MQKKITGVRFKKAGKVYYFDPKKVYLNIGDHVIVETARGLELGEVASRVKFVDEKELKNPLKPVIRKATDKDMKTYEENLIKAEEALEICKKEIEKEGLDMKLIRAEYTFDGNKVIFYFTADGRIDFRELVKKLAAIFRIRIELRQIGVRDEAKIKGGIGPCGCGLCCNQWLGEFQPVSIKMAKEQGLSLNPTKISGICGRLLCCLQFEQECYEEALSRLPRIGDKVKTEEGIGIVNRLNVLKEKVLVKIDKGEGDFTFIEFNQKDIKILKKKNCKNGQCQKNGNKNSKNNKKNVHAKHPNQDVLEEVSEAELKELEKAD